MFKLLITGLTQRIQYDKGLLIIIKLSEASPPSLVILLALEPVFDSRWRQFFISFKHQTNPPESFTNSDYMQNVMFCNLA